MHKLAKAVFWDKRNGTHVYIGIPQMKITNFSSKAVSQRARGKLMLKVCDSHNRGTWIIYGSVWHLCHPFVRQICVWSRWLSSAWMLNLVIVNYRIFGRNQITWTSFKLIQPTHELSTLWESPVDVYGWCFHCNVHIRGSQIVMFVNLVGEVERGQKSKVCSDTMDAVVPVHQYSVSNYKMVPHDSVRWFLTTLPGRHISLVRT